jgi:hypothetical protein
VGLDGVLFDLWCVVLCVCVCVCVCMWGAPRRSHPAEGIL